MGASGAAFAAAMNHLGRARHLAAQIVAMCQQSGLRVPESLTWHYLAERWGHLIGSALRPMASGHCRIGHLVWREAPAARTPTEPADFLASETKATSFDLAAVTRSN